MIDYSTFPRYQVNTARYVGGKGRPALDQGQCVRRRGLYTLGPTTLETGDPFGLFRVTIEYAQSETMLVVPPVIPLPSIEIAIGDRIGEGGIKVTTPRRTVTASGVREYAPGDSLFSVHWMTSARLDDLYVRMFDRQPTSDWWVIVDLDATGTGGRRDAKRLRSTALSWRPRSPTAGCATVGRWGWWPPAMSRSGCHRRPGPASAGRSCVRWRLLDGASILIFFPGRNPALHGAQHQRDRHHAIREPGLAESRDEPDAAGYPHHGAAAGPDGFGGEASSVRSSASCAAWGINHYRITPEIYEQPVVRDLFAWQKSQHSSSSFTASDLDWSKL